MSSGMVVRVVMVLAMRSSSDGEALGDVMLDSSYPGVGASSRTALLEERE